MAAFSAVFILFLPMKKYRYHCGNCDEVFYSERPNMNERHHCGALGSLDWKYDGTEGHQEDHGH